MPTIPVPSSSRLDFGFDMQSIQPESGRLLPGSDSATRHLVAFACRLDPQELPAGVIRQATRCVLDLLGVAIAGASTSLAAVSRRYAAEQFAPGLATVIGSPHSLGVAGASWLNCTAASALDMDDGHRLAMGHPGACVIPAALAVAEVTGSTGLEFLAAVVAGYEVAVRASAARLAWYKDRQYSSGIWGVFGIVAAAGRLFGFDEDTLESALGIAAAHGPFPPSGSQANDSMIKEVIGWAGLAGSSAALLARQGFTGPRAVFDFAERWDTGQLVAGLGDWQHLAILGAYFKPYAVCRWSHPAVDAVISLVAQAGLRPEDVRRVEVHGFRELTRLANYSPANTVAAQYSLPFAVALALRYGEIGPQHVTTASLGDSALLDLARRVHIAVDPQFDALFPARTAARVTLHTGRGAFEATVDSPRGDPLNPLSDAELSVKFRSLTGSALGEPASEALLAAIQDLPGASDVKTVTRSLAFQPGSAS